MPNISQRQKPENISQNNKRVKSENGKKSQDGRHQNLKIIIKSSSRPY
jgi:hypothetical protein